VIVCLQKTDSCLGNFVAQKVAQLCCVSDMGLTIQLEELTWISDGHTDDL